LLPSRLFDTGLSRSSDGKVIFFVALVGGFDEGIVLREGQMSPGALLLAGTWLSNHLETKGVPDNIRTGEEESFHSIYANFIEVTESSRDRKKQPTPILEQ
jgi:hypothetical protein